MKKIPWLIPIALLAFFLSSSHFVGCGADSSYDRSTYKSSENDAPPGESAASMPETDYDAPVPPPEDEFLVEESAISETVKTPPRVETAGAKKKADEAVAGDIAATGDVKSITPTAHGEPPPPEQVDIEIAKPTDKLEPKIIYKASVTVRVNDLDKGIIALQELTDQYKGRIIEVNSSFQRDDADEYGEAFITIKVPFDKVQEYVTSLGGLGKVETSQMTSEDVTLQWYEIQKDVERRKIDLEQKYLEFKNDPSNISKKRAYIRHYNEYLEQAKRAAELSYEAEMSTVHVTLVSYLDLWMSALNIGLDILYYIFIVVIVLLPCAVLTFLIIWFIRWIMKMRKKKTE